MFPYPLTEMSFAYPWWLAAPIVFGLAYLIRANKRSYVLHPQVDTLQALPRGIRSRIRTPILAFLLLAFIGFLSLAASRPQKVTAVFEKTQSRNLMLALDISRSMSDRDFGAGFGRLARIDAVKAVVTEFVEARPLDRIGLSVFGSNAFLQSPLTRDHGLLLQLVRRLQVGLAGDGTAIGDGLGLALKRVAEIDGDSKAIILMTDGVSNAGKVDPVKAAQVAKDLGVTVHTIGIGGNSRSSTFGLPGGITLPLPRRQSNFDEATLREIADITGGVYFHAENLAGLHEIYDEINRLEQTETEEPQLQRVEEFYHLALLYSLISYVTYLTLARTFLRRIP